MFGVKKSGKNFTKCFEGIIEKNNSSKGKNRKNTETVSREISKNSNYSNYVFHEQPQLNTKFISLSWGRVLSQEGKSFKFGGKYISLHQWALTQFYYHIDKKNYS